MLRQAERRPRLGATLVPGGRLHEGLPAGDGVREPLDVFEGWQRRLQMGVGILSLRNEKRVH